MAKVSKRVWRTSEGEQRQAWRVDFVDSAGQRQRRQFRSRREADAFRVQIEGELRSGTFRPEAGKITVREVADQYLEYVRGRARRRERFSGRHLLMVEGRIFNYVCPDRDRAASRKARTRVTLFADGIGDMTLARLTARGVGDFRDRLRDAGLSVQTTRKVLTTLHAILEFAISRDYVAANAAKGVKVIGTRDEGPIKIVPPSKEALRALIDVADQDFRLKLVFAAATGVRAGELHALRWRHVDFAAGTVTIETRVDNRGVEDVTKTRAGMRTIPLGGPVLAALKEWKLRSSFKKQDDLLFPNARGRYVSHGNMVKRQFDPLFDKLAEQHAADPHNHPPPPVRFNWHALRHFAVSVWIEAGLQPKVIQEFAGHSDLQTTMSRYGHMLPSPDHSRTMDAIARGLFT